MSTQFSPDIFETYPDVDEHLKDVPVVFMLIANLREQAVSEGREWHDNAYDRTLWELIGNPELWATPGHFPEVQRNTPTGLVIYDIPEKASYSDHHIVYVRGTSQTTEEPFRKFVATTDLRTGTRKECYVAEQRDASNPYSMVAVHGVELILSDRLLQPVPDLDASNSRAQSYLRAIIDSANYRQAQTDFAGNQPRIISTNQGGWFVSEQNGCREPLSSIMDIRYKLAKFYEEFGELSATLIACPEASRMDKPGVARGFYANSVVQLLDD